MIEQIGIALFGVPAIALANTRNPAYQRWAPVLGLTGQVFWFWMALDKELWGVLFMSFIYSAAWLLGLYNYWFAKDGSKVGI